MSQKTTHAFTMHGCFIRNASDNTAAVCEFPKETGREPAEFTSEPLVVKDGVAIAGEPTATMQAIHAAKAWFLEDRAAAAKIEESKIAAAVEKAKAKAEAALTTKSRGK